MCSVDTFSSSVWSLQCSFCSWCSWFVGGEGMQTVNCLSLVPHFCGRTVPVVMCMESRVMQILCMQDGDTLTMQRECTKSCQAIASYYAAHLDFWKCTEYLTNCLQHFDKVHICFQLPSVCFWMFTQTNQTIFFFIMVFTAVHGTLVEWMQRSIIVEVQILFFLTSWIGPDLTILFACKSMVRNVFVFNY